MEMALDLIDVYVPVGLGVFRRPAHVLRQRKEVSEQEQVAVYRLEHQRRALPRQRALVVEGAHCQHLPQLRGAGIVLGRQGRSQRRDGLGHVELPPQRGEDLVEVVGRLAREEAAHQVVLQDAQRFRQLRRCQHLVRVVERQQKCSAVCAYIALDLDFDQHFGRKLAQLVLQ